MLSEDDLYGSVRNGVLTISGSNPSIKVENGMLVVRDGPRSVPADLRGPAPPVETRMETLRLSRAGCSVKNIVVTRPDGFITFAAIEWIHEAGISLAQIDWHGEILLSKGPPGPDRPAMRRAQALAAGTDTGLAIMREILRHKLAGEAAVARLLGGEDAATLIERLAGDAAAAQSGDNPGPKGLRILAIEASAAAAYWSLWSGVTMRFARHDRVPEHWQAFGSRRSTIAGNKTTRHASNAPGAMLNYLYGLAASQMTIALAAAGLDPGIGIFHADKESRASLGYDAIEAVRPYVEAWLLCSLAECRFSKRDFWEESDGTIRLTRPLTSWLAMTAPLWRRAAEVVAVWLAAALETASRGIGEATEAARQPRPALRHQTPLPADPDRDMARFPPLPAPLPDLPAPGRVYKPALAHEVLPHACHECGKSLIPGGRGSRGPRKFCSPSCSAIYRSEMRRLSPTDARPAEIEAIRSSDRGRSDKLRRRAIAQHEWNKSYSAEADALRRWYAAEIAPKLTEIPRTEIGRAIQTSYNYARLIGAGLVPHPRHFEALAALVGSTMPQLKGPPP